MISVIFLKLKRPSFFNMHHSCGGFAVCVCVWVCVLLGVAGGSQYTTSCEPPCGLAVLLGRPVPHQSREFVI